MRAEGKPSAPFLTLFESIACLCYNTVRQPFCHHRTHGEGRRFLAVCLSLSDGSNCGTFTYTFHAKPR